MAQVSFIDFNAKIFQQYPFVTGMKFFQALLNKCDFLGQQRIVSLNVCFHDRNQIIGQSQINRYFSYYFAVRETRVAW